MCNLAEVRNHIGVASSALSCLKYLAFLWLHTIEWLLIWLGS